MAAVGQANQDIGFSRIGRRAEGSDEDPLMAAHLAAEGGNDGFVIGIGGPLEAEDFDDLGLGRADPMLAASAHEPGGVGRDVELSGEPAGLQEGNRLGDGQFIAGHGVREVIGHRSGRRRDR